MGRQTAMKMFEPYLKPDYLRPEQSLVLLRTHVKVLRSHFESYRVLDHEASQRKVLERLIVETLERLQKELGSDDI